MRTSVRMEHEDPSLQEPIRPTPKFKLGDTICDWRSNRFHLIAAVGLVGDYVCYRVGEGFGAMSEWIIENESMVRVQILAQEPRA